MHSRQEVCLQVEFRQEAYHQEVSKEASSHPIKALEGLFRDQGTNELLLMNLDIF